MLAASSHPLGSLKNEHKLLLLYLTIIIFGMT